MLTLNYSLSFQTSQPLTDKQNLHLLNSLNDLLSSGLPTERPFDHLDVPQEVSHATLIQHIVLIK